MSFKSRWTIVDLFIYSLMEQNCDILVLGKLLIQILIENFVSLFY